VCGRDAPVRPGQYGHRARLTVETRFRNYLVLVVVLIIGLATAGAVIVGGVGRSDPNQPPADANQVVGVVVGVDSKGLTDVQSFTLRTTSDTNMVFALDKLQNGATFAPGHLVEHQASSTPIQVWYRTQDGINYAVWMADAGQTG
jgi:hypothetical protein